MRKISMLLIAVSLMIALLLPGFAVAKGRQKVDVCHQNGNGSYRLISVSEKALPAHLAHGDALPGDIVGDKILGDDCSLLDTILEQSVGLNYSSTGWGGWSCPAGTKVADAWVEGITAAQSALWRPGASLAGYDYPITPFGYTYTPPEEGFIAQADGTGGPATIYLICY